MKLVNNNNYISISGTEKQHVADDYAKRLHIGEVECRALVSASLNALIQKVDDPMNLTYCEYLNISACPTSESGNVCTVLTRWLCVMLSLI